MPTQEEFDAQVRRADAAERRAEQKQATADATYTEYTRAIAERDAHRIETQTLRSEITALQMENARLLAHLESVTGTDEYKAARLRFLNERIKTTDEYMTRLKSERDKL